MYSCLHIRHSILHPRVEFQRNKANINIVIVIQSILSPIQWPLFEDEKEETVRIGDINFHQNSYCVDMFATKRDAEQTYEYNT